MLRKSCRWKSEGEEAGIHVYAVHLPALPRQVLVDAASPLVNLHLAEGWGPIPDVQGRCLPAGDAVAAEGPAFSEGGERSSVGPTKDGFVY